MQTDDQDFAWGNKFNMAQGRFADDHLPHVLAPYGPPRHLDMISSPDISTLLDDGDVKQ